MGPAGVLLAALSAAELLLHVCCAQSVTAVYNQTIAVPCNKGAPPPSDLMFVKWKYEKDDGSAGDLLVKQVRSQQTTVLATDAYAQRVSVDPSLGLLIRHASLLDQRTFTCMVVSASNILEFPVAVAVTKEPSSVQVMDKSDALQEDKLSTVGTCVAAEANPAAIIAWMKNGEPLVADGKAVLITPSLKVDPATGLSTTSSTLQVTADRQDGGSVFSCVSTHLGARQVVDLEPFPVHYPPERLSLLVLPDGPVVEGSNVTLRCQADGNPPPQSFYFHIQGQRILVEGADSYTLSGVSRRAAGEYKCSLADNPTMETSQTLAVSYLDLSLIPTGRVVKKVGDSFSVKMEKNSSGDASVVWTKDERPVEEPRLPSLQFAHAGVYACLVSIPGLSRNQSFELVVEGKPVITGLTKRPAEDAKQEVLSCEAEGVPEPRFHWSISGTNEERSYSNGRAVHRITVVPKFNLTVTCSVSNQLGGDVMSINVSSVMTEENGERGSGADSEDRARLVSGLVVGLLLAAAAVGLVYWLYRKNSRQGSWTTEEKEAGTSEESRRLEENHAA
ncbi:CD166 antigen homolog A-like [Salarias fasciatus]|uniref:CD166 antigen homolog A-like n=1 Tax=Salarias fasciatus TaxID=181472 RepID=A0A672FBG3_SALFA|nr:CD166 antigen homolog A-like [Salarias fasciatus]